MFFLHFFTIAALALSGVRGAALPVPNDSIVDTISESTSDDLPPHSLDISIKYPTSFLDDPLGAFPLDSLLNLTAVTNSDADAGRFTHRCDTTEASPTKADLQGLAKKLALTPFYRICKQTNKLGSHCTMMEKYGSAAVSMCGAGGEFMMCKDIAVWVSYIWARCAGTGKGQGHAGGVVDRTKTMRLVFH